MNVLITSNKSLFTKVDHINTINTKEESIIIENCYDRLLFNCYSQSFENTQFELSSFIDSI